jgi:putative two-component system response regulator
VNVANIKQPDIAFPQARIVVIDDNHENVKLIARFLEWAGYVEVMIMTDSARALEHSLRTQPDLILLDLHMPKPTGYDILEALREEGSPLTYTPILVFTADQTPETKARALNLGASDFLTKPGDAQEILLRVRNFLQLRHMHLSLQQNNDELVQRVEMRTKELSIARREALETLARVAEFRDDSTGQHTRRVGDLSASIATHLGQSEDFIETLRLVAPLHDVGKVSLPDSILLKPGVLTDEERSVMQRHTTVAESVFAGMKSPLMRIAKEIAVNHHERWDGRGYPNGLAGNVIPLAARIVAVADVYDALTNPRPYKESWTASKAVDEIKLKSGTHFDPAVVEAFLRSVEDTHRLPH